jgi:hypothetical protein
MLAKEAPKMWTSKNATRKFQSVVISELDRISVEKWQREWD